MQRTAKQYLLQIPARVNFTEVTTYVTIRYKFGVNFIHARVTVIVLTTNTQICRTSLHVVPYTIFMARHCFEATFR